jgi:Domain of unknown function (DUF1905)
MIGFEAVIETGAGGGAYVVVPDTAVESMGGGGRIPVLATFDGVDYRGSVVRRGGHPLIGVLKEIRSTIGKGPGDRVAVTLERDEKERVVDLPSELASALEGNQAARSAFQALSFTHPKRACTLCLGRETGRDMSTPGTAHSGLPALNLHRHIHLLGCCRC